MKTPKSTRTAPTAQPAPLTDANTADLIADLERETPAAEVIRNRFLQHLPLENIIFHPNVQQPGQPWNDGTIPRQLATVTIMLGDTGAILSGRIQHLKFTDGSQKFDLMLPSTKRAGGKISVPVIDTGGQSSEVGAALAEWKTLVVNKWITERTKARAGGAPAIASSSRMSGVTVDDSILDNLGIVAAKPSETPKADAPAPTAEAAAKVA